jgi:hypothetical protein
MSEQSTAQSQRVYEGLRKLQQKAANTKTMPIFTASRSQNRFLKNAKSTPTMMAAIATT